MGVFVRPPFALFSLANLPVRTINLKLQEAYDGATADRWYSWLATKNYDDAQQKNPDHGSDGTEAPIDESFTSPWVGQSVEAAAEFLSRAPDSVDVERRFFAVLDDRTEKDGSVVMCRIGDMEGQGDRVECIRVSQRVLRFIWLGWSMEHGKSAWMPWRWWGEEG